MNYQKAFVIDDVQGIYIEFFIHDSSSKATLLRIFFFFLDKNVSHDGQCRLTYHFELLNHDVIVKLESVCIV